MRGKGCRPYGCCCGDVVANSRSADISRPCGRYLLRPKGWACLEIVDLCQGRRHLEVDFRHQFTGAPRRWLEATLRTRLLTKADINGIQLEATEGYVEPLRQGPEILIDRPQQ